MRFAWLRSKRDDPPLPPPSPPTRLVVVAYNVVWWIPLALPLVGLISYTTGLVAFLLITIARAVINLYRNNVLPIELGETFPLRSP